MKKRLVFFMMALTFIVSSTVATLPREASAAEARREVDSIIRIEGANRYKTTVKISQDVFPEGSKEAVIASGEKFADALVGGNLAAHIDGPILLVRENDIPEEIVKELGRLKVENIYIVGGESSVSKGVEVSLKDYAGKVERLKGDNRYLTSVDVADKMVKEGAVEGIAYASGQNFPDALAGSSLLANLGNHTLILTDGKNIPEGAPDRENKIVFGGPNTINIGGLEDASRYGKTDRFLTALEIADKGFGEYHTAILVDGTNYPDALTAVSLAKKYHAPILLTYPKLITKETLEAMKDLDQIIIVGGKSSVSEDVVEQIVNSTLAEKPVDPEDIEKPVDPEKPTGNLGPSESDELGLPYKGFGIDVRDTSLNSEEAELARLINAERVKAGRKPLKVSKQLTKVARFHVIDSNAYFDPYNPPVDSRGIEGNMHSWSSNGKGEWTPVIYTRDHKYAKLMHTKPKEITGYKGNGYEISTTVAYIDKPASALKQWMGSLAHKEVMLEQGKWKNSKFETMGISIAEDFSHVWFGKEVDETGYFSY